MASAYLTRNVSCNRQTWTWSAWVKRSKIDSYQNMFAGGTSGSADTAFNFNADGALSLYHRESSSLRGYFESTRKLRDTNGWYHLVANFDATNATGADRLVIYVNGERAAGTMHNTLPQNDSGYIGNGSAADIGRMPSGTASYFDGQMTHIHFVDGTIYGPSTFGETDATTGIWKAKTSPTVTYGSGGFFLKMDNSGNMGLDSSGNSNNFTTNGTIIQNKDTPSNVFCTMNPLDNYWQASTFANINNTFTTVASKENYNTSTLAMSSNDAGKYYCEVKVVSASAYTVLGLAGKVTTSATSNFKNHSDGYALTSDSGNIINNNSSSSYGVSYTTNDIIGIAVDTDNNKLYFSKNGTWMNSGVPTSGSTGTGAISITTDTTNGYYLFAGGTRHSDSVQLSWNFGNGYFGTTAVSSAQNPDDGIGIFEYDVPAGYRALCTKSLNAQEYN